MQDMVIKGTGNSRFLKSVENFLDLFPTYEAFAAAFASGVLPVDFNGINPDGITQMGTPYAKATVLTDETAALFGLDETAVPDDVWKSIVAAAFTMTSNLRIKHGESESTARFGFSSSGNSVWMGRTSNGDDAEVAIYANGVADLKNAFKVKYGDTAYDIVHAGNRAETGTAQIARGSYVGTGSYGANNKNTLTGFEFRPRMIVIMYYSESVYTYGGIAVYGNNKYYVFSDYNLIGNFEWKENSVSWYHTASESSQLNRSGDIYHYIVIG